jgi:hypothetical protein
LDAFEKNYQFARRTLLPYNPAHYSRIHTGPAARRSVLGLSE